EEVQPQPGAVAGDDAFALHAPPTGIGQDALGQGAREGVVREAVAADRRAEVPLEAAVAEIRLGGGRFGRSVVGYPCGAAVRREQRPDRILGLVVGTFAEV